MAERTAARSVEAVDDAAEGTTIVLTAEGWEQSDYVEPGDDWHLLIDGSYVSPDRTMRSWPLVSPAFA
jgi:hypothetical protein